MVNARQSAAASLIPLIKQSRDLLAQMGEESPITLPGGRCSLDAKVRMHFGLP